MKYWLMKSEPNTYSIEDLQKEGVTHWEGVRNYQARNFMRDDMKIGDQVLFYHSNATPPGIVGLAEVCKEAYPDHFAYDPKSAYFDSKSKKDSPRWMMVDVKFCEKFDQIISLDQLKRISGLQTMLVIKKGMRLSIQPVEKEHYSIIVNLARKEIAYVD